MMQHEVTSITWNQVLILPAAFSFIDLVTQVSVVGKTKQ